jgi:hypothetical protein
MKKLLAIMLLLGVSTHVLGESTHTFETKGYLEFYSYNVYTNPSNYQWHYLGGLSNDIASWNIQTAANCVPNFTNGYLELYYTPKASFMAYKNVFGDLRTCSVTRIQMTYY